MRTLGTYKTSNIRSTTSKTMVALGRINRSRGTTLSNYRNAIQENKPGDNFSSTVLV